MENRSVVWLPWRALGLRPYVEVWELQETLRKRVLEDGSVGELLLTEHPPTISLGRGERGMNLLFGRADLGRQGFEVVETNRGGKVTYHGPGQLVAYPVIDLRKFKMGVKQYVAALEETMIRLLSSLGLEAERREGAPGTWVGGKKIGSIGIHVRKQVTIHGLALNIATDLSHFDVITPCGIPGVRMTSVRAEGVSLSMSEADRKFVEMFATVFRCEIVEAQPVENFSRAVND